MSIYCSTFGLDEHAPRCKRVTRLERNVYEQDDSKPCTCGGVPIKYKGSHVFPSDSDERGGCLSLGAIPSHITRDGRDDGPEGKWCPWLRVSVFTRECGSDYDTVLLTRVQVEQLRDALSAWLDNAATSSTAKKRAKKGGKK